MILQRVALGVSYNGQAYDGWQSQPSCQTVQDQLECALGKFVDAPRISTLCAGRTDAGVHGLMQVVHFDTEADRPLQGWVRGTNSFLPADISVQWAHYVPANFHCRASAISRRYVYVLLESDVRPSVEQGRVGWVFQPLNLDDMTLAAQALLGTHDFSSFRAAACQALSPIKHLMRLEIFQKGAYWRFEFEANAFLHHMIRNIMGCLIAIGQGRQTPQWMVEVLEARSRAVASPTFGPEGLYFMGPRYENHWGLPERTPAYDWLP